MRPPNFESTIHSSYRNHPYPRPNFRNLGYKHVSETIHSATWTAAVRKAARRMQRFEQERRKAGKELDSETRLFARSESHFQEDVGGDWECTAILGQGSFGKVGLWQLLDSATGAVLDSVAIKQIVNDEKAGLVECDDYTVPMEALCMYELRDCPTVCQLRGLKRFRHSRPEERVWRLYQQYCEGGTIREMIKIYKRFNEDNPYDMRRIPESYVWWVWHGLALALEAMDDSGKCSQMRNQPPGSHRWMVHLDIKDTNVLLGRPPKDGPLHHWPMVKVADWGLATVTSSRDPRNSECFSGMGTRCWFPPEQFDSRGLGRRWRTDIHGRHTPYTSDHACWQFAALIFSMVQLQEHNEMLEGYLYSHRNNEEHFRKQNYKLFVYQPHAELSQQYSADLLRLLEDCLHLKPGRRPSPESLKRRTMAGCAKSFQAIDRERRPGAPHVFFGKNGLNDMKRWKVAHSR